MPFTSVQRRRRGYSSPRAERVSWDLSLARDWPAADCNAVEVVGYVSWPFWLVSRHSPCGKRQTGLRGANDPRLGWRLVAGDSRLRRFLPAYADIIGGANRPTLSPTYRTPVHDIRGGG